MPVEISYDDLNEVIRLNPVNTAIIKIELCNETEEVIEDIRFELLNENPLIFQVNYPDENSEYKLTLSDDPPLYITPHRFVIMRVLTEDSIQYFYREGAPVSELRFAENFSFMSVTMRKLNQLIRSGERLWRIEKISNEIEPWHNF